jgi:hypothetical protein
MKTLPESGFLSNFVEVAVAGLDDTNLLDPERPRTAAGGLHLPRRNHHETAPFPAGRGGLLGDV